MKRIAYSFFFIALLSCGASHPSWDNRITLVSLDSSARSDVYLLAVRSESLVVAPYKDENVTSQYLSEHAQVVPFKKLQFAYYESETTSGVWTGIVGLILGTGAGCAVGGTQMKSEGDFETLFAYGAIGGVLGFAVPAFLFMKSHTEENLIDLTRESDLRDLRSRTFYQTEPPELQKIQ